VELLEDRTLLSVNPIVAENQLPGTPQSVWGVNGAGDTSIQGFSTDISVDHGQTVSFKINDSANAPYHIDIYRMGYYQGNGARLVTTLSSSQVLKQVQPNPLTDTATGLVDAGNWAVSASWAVPASATSGIYFARVTRDDTGNASLIYFVVRDDEGASDLLFQTSDSTWQAYNQWGGNSLYLGSGPAPDRRAYKVSYNRPLVLDGIQGGYGDYNSPLHAEYPMVRWLEANGYNVSYFTDVDSDRRGSEILEHKVFLSVGHDEYWSGQQRANVQAARDAGVNLAFFSGNESFWKTRWETSIDGSGTAYRTLVTYKESKDNAQTDPLDLSQNVWTGTWRDSRFSPPADGGRPENSMSGTMYMNDRTSNDLGIPLTVSAADGKLRFWRNTSVASLAAGQTATLGQYIVGYEVDEDVDNGFRPAGLMDMSGTTFDTPSHVIAPWGTVVGTGTGNHKITLYRAASGALVFGAGTIQWSWGLDGNHNNTATTPETAMQQATVNLFADMHVQPGTLQSGLVAATASTDTVAPTSTITAPPAGSVFQVGQSVTISGTATDTGGGVVGGVEVSVDGGTTWHAVTGRTTWSYTWSPANSGPAVIKSRAVDDSGNLEAPSAGVSVTVQLGSGPFSIWAPSAVPAVAADIDGSSVELGVKFRSDVAGYVTGVRFYKGSMNTGTHVGTLWSSTGTALASATFTNETASGWQQVNFSSPVAVSANTTYVVSYHAPNGHYAGDNNYFATTGADYGPLHALASGVDGGDGVYASGTASAFPSSSYQSTNYWVDVVFSANSAAVVPTVARESPAPSATGVSTTTAVTATFNESVQAGTISFVLTGPNNTTVPATVSYNDPTLTATLTPGAPLAASTTYTATVSGATDAAGDVMTPFLWSFTTAAPVAGTAPYSIWSSTAAPVVAASSDTNAVEVGVKFRSDMPGYVTGVRFYKGSTNTGTHVGNLWTSTGTLLATGTFANETASGWQELDFSSPVAISANTTYVVSYHTNVGHYAADSNAFAASGVDNGPLHALSSGAAGGNGVYTYGATSAFPTSSFQSTNYWVDVFFSPHVLSQTTAADFSAGTQSNTVVTSTSGGEAQLAYTFADDFLGSSISSAWTITPWSSSASITVANSTLSVSAAEALSTQTSTNTGVEARLTIGAAASEQFGLATDLAVAKGNYWAVFTTRTTSTTLYAETNVNGTLTDVSLGALPSGMHVYKVQPITTGFQFYIDGALKTTISKTLPTGTALKVALSANKASPSPALQADWVHLLSYVSSGTFTSAVLDAGQVANWGVVDWNAVVPAGTTLTVQVRTGNTATPDSSWTAWTTVTDDAVLGSPASEFLQYRVILTTSNSTQTAVLDDITFDWS
jgi:hypothetical protein